MFWNCGYTARAKLEKVASTVKEGEMRAYVQCWAMGGIVSRGRYGWSTLRVTKLLLLEEYKSSTVSLENLNAGRL